MQEREETENQEQMQSGRQDTQDYTQELNCPPEEQAERSKNKQN